MKIVDVSFYLSTIRLFIMKKIFIPSLICVCILTASACMSPDDWVAQNKPINTGTGNNNNNNTVTIPDYVKVYEVDEPVREFDTITIHVASLSGVRAVEIPEVKYNLKTILTILSDDMSKNDLTMGWALFNGYAAGPRMGVKRNELEKVITGEAIHENYIGLHEPWEYSSDDGKSRRWAMTSAIWPAQGLNGNYMSMDANDAVGMIRMGHSFALHDVETNLNGISLEKLASVITYESDKWKELVGIGTKVMAEPNGDKQYVEASRLSDRICMSIYQAASTGYLSPTINGSTYYYKQRQSEEDTEIRNGELTRLTADWAQGDCVPDFQNKAHDNLTRFFIVSGKASFQLGENLAKGENQINVFGMHGVSTQMGDELQKLRTRKDLWVASMDEVWEYYYLKKVTRLNVSQDGESTVIELIVPQYPNHQFRDLTLKLDASDVSNVSFSSNVVTSGWRQNDGYCTINVGLETRMYKYITEYLNLLNRYRNNIGIRRDLNYLLNLLTDGEQKDYYQALYEKLTQ